MESHVIFLSSIFLLTFDALTFLFEIEMLPRVALLSREPSEVRGGFQPVLFLFFFL